MKFRTGVTAGFCMGYYFGSKAGRERYFQLNRLLRKFRYSDTIDAATGKAKAVVDLTKERARDMMESHKTPSNGDGTSIASNGTSGLNAF